MRRSIHSLVIVIGCFAFGGCVSSPTDGDLGVGDPTADTADSAEPGDSSSPDLGPTADTNLTTDLTTDDGAADVSVDTGGADTTPEDVTTAEDTAASDAGVMDAGVADAAVMDAGVADAGVADMGVTDVAAMDGAPMDGAAFCVNCPGTKAPTWELQDFQPASPMFGQSYGLEAFEGKVTLMVLLAGW